MSAKQRADLITKLYKYVKKNYQVVSPPSNRTVIEHLVYGSCLENATFEAADDVFAKLQENYFDWNEIRVTTVAELAEVTKGHVLPAESARGVKKTLHGVFENYYQFDLDFLRKENLSKAVQTFQKFHGVSNFIVSYVAQNGLGGHSIPIDRSMMLLFYVLGIVTEEESAKGKVPGLERTIPKAKGVEFFNLTHQFAVEFASSPFKPATREKILKLCPSAKERFPKRGAKRKPLAPPEPEKKEEEVVEPVPEPKKTKAAATAEKKTKAAKKSAKKAAKPAKKVTAKAKTKATTKAKATTKKKATKVAAKKTTKKKAAKKTTKKKASSKLKKKKPR